MILRSTGCCQTARATWPGLAAVASMLSVLLLSACAHPNRYAIFSEEGPHPAPANSAQRLICLKKDDAQQHAAIVALRTDKDIEKYEKSNPGDRAPVDEILYRLVRGDYARAEELLRQNGDALPDYLRLVLRADLASEGQEEDVETGRLVELYQEAHDHPGCELNRGLIKLRIRQLRYRR